MEITQLLKKQFSNEGKEELYATLISIQILFENAIVLDLERVIQIILYSTCESQQILAQRKANLINMQLYMMIQRVRLQRKFTLKCKVDPLQRLLEIMQMMIIFQLATIFLTCLLSFSIHFHINHIFTGELWTSDSVVNSNLSLAICLLLLLPYLIFWKGVLGSTVKDFVATALTIHTLIAFFINLKITIAFIIFMLVLGVIGAVIGTYGARIREQSKLIQEIRNIEGEDRKQIRLPVEQFQRKQLHMPSDN